MPLPTASSPSLCPAQPRDDWRRRRSVTGLAESLEGLGCHKEKRENGSVHSAETGRQCECSSVEAQFIVEDMKWSVDSIQFIVEKQEGIYST